MLNMAWDSVSLLRKHKTRIVSQVMAGMSSISPDIPGEKCSRDLNYILTAIAECLESNNQKSLMYVIKNYFRGGKLRLRSIDLEIQAYGITENIIHNLFDRFKIDPLYKQKVTDCFDVIKENFKNGYTDTTYPDNNWTQMLEAKKQCATWSDKKVDKEYIDSILDDIHKHCNSKQNKVPYEIKVMDWSNPELRDLLFRHARDEETPEGKIHTHYNTQVLAPYVLLFFERDDETYEVDVLHKIVNLEIGLSLQIAALSAVSKGLSIGFCKCFNEKDRNEFCKKFNVDNSPNVVLGIGYYKESDTQINPYTNIEYTASISTSDRDKEQWHIKPAMKDYIAYV